MSTNRVQILYIDSPFAKVLREIISLTPVNGKQGRVLNPPYSTQKTIHVFKIWVNTIQDYSRR
jgi:hypothetical protein